MPSCGYSNLTLANKMTLAKLEKQKCQLLSADPNNLGLCSILASDPCFEIFVRNLRLHKKAMEQFPCEIKRLEAGITILNALKMQLMNLKSIATEGSTTASQTQLNILQGRFNALLSAIKSQAENYRDPDSDETSIISNYPGAAGAAPAANKYFYSVILADGTYIYASCNVVDFISVIASITGTASQAQFLIACTEIETALEGATITQAPVLPDPLTGVPDQVITTVEQTSVCVCIDILKAYLTAIEAFKCTAEEFVTLYINNINTYKVEKCAMIQQDIDAINLSSC